MALHSGRLLTGALASGKTTRLLASLRASFAGPADIRLVVPTATMVRHLRHELARQGAVVRPRAIVTLSGFVEELTPGVEAVTPGALVLIARQLLRETNAWGASARTKGFLLAVTNTIGELDARGYSSADVRAAAALVEDAPPEPGLFLDFFARVEFELAARGLVLQSGRLRAATQSAFQQGIGAWKKILVDGFFSFTEPELTLLNALRRHAEVMVTLPDWAGAERARHLFRQYGFEEETTEARTGPVAIDLVTAGSMEAEVGVLCQRILAEHEHGTPFRQMGIVLREPEPYAAALRTALDRFGIPARFYFVDSLDDTPRFRFFDALAAAARSGWDHERVLAALAYQASGFGGTDDGDALEYQIRERLPNSGLEPLLLLDPRFELFNRFDHFWHALATPEVHAATLTALMGEADAPVAVARAMKPVTMTGAEFWEEFAAMASFTPVRLEDQRRDVVHVIDVYEARQWRLPVIFVPGMLEGRFPKHGFDDPLLPDRFRQRLVELGLPVRTLAERQVEEDFLFDLARSRAGRAFIPSYPRVDARGEATLPSFFLDGIQGRAATASAVLPRPAAILEPAETGISRGGSLERLRGRHRVWRPTGLESFLQCPYQFFGRYSLRLEGVPPRPEDRLDRLAQGGLVHDVLAFWQRDPQQPIERIFDKLFTRKASDLNARAGYRLEMDRLEMQRHLVEFTRHFAVPGGWTPHYEMRLRFALEPGVDLSGRVDRYDVSPDGDVAVYDFKYSGGEAIRRKVRDHEEFPQVQGGLYLIGLRDTLHLKPKSFHYVALRDEAREHGWSEPTQVTALMERARELALDAVERIRSGDIRVMPRDRDLCAFCDFRDACRVAAPAREEIAIPAVR